MESILEEYRLTVDDVANFYGVQISTVQRWIRTGRLAAKKFGKRYHVSKKDLLTFDREGFAK